MTEEPRVKRMRIRAWRRGIKEMDLILGGYANDRLAGLSAEGLDLFEALLGENDQDLFAWVTGQAAPPPRFAPLIRELAHRVPGTAQ
ncbi:FAD assembly factor SdhE [Jannaschia ovalis]|uniref:FAD assembly factor SdhE n=1 Tax=Jannaschia ovalis TaxID=3038773 RepID=A0ABY8LAD3_9RHOB|nr:succinate dehydrogenase assembly factor 2 [Jannaschia sp. GRR-S6-38]WGH78091.1 succinate dehydrogenase assembly factor 2 [Jannaschia sp. GRR-S6-38]